MATQHKDLTGADLHSPFSFTYTDESARTSASGFSVGDVGKLAFQQSDKTAWILTATMPTWSALGSGTSGGGSTFTRTSGKAHHFNGGMKASHYLT